MEFQERMNTGKGKFVENIKFKINTVTISYEV